MSSHIVTTSDGVRLNMTALGGRGPTLLFVHGASLCGSMFGPLAAALRDNFTCVALDLRGHGHSSRPKDGNYGWSRLGDDVAEVLDGLDGPVYGFGHSLGGTALLLAAARRPGRLSALCCYEPVLLDNARADGSAEEQALRSERRHERFAGPEVARARLFSKPPLDHLAAGAVDSYLRDGFEHALDGSMRLALAPGDEAALYRAGIGAQLESELSKVETRVTVLLSAGTQSAAVLGAERLHSLIPEATVLEIRDSSHFAPLEHPEVIATEVITAFDTAGA